MSKIIKKCKCGKEFTTTDWKIRIGRGTYCSRKCIYKYRIRPHGLKYTIETPNSGWFHKENKPWNYGLTGLQVPWNKGLGGTHFSPQTEFKVGENKGFLNNKWKGDDVGYGGLHTWLARELGHTDHCAICHTGTAKLYIWHNVSMEYRRNLNDWVQLCQSCHVKLHRQIKKQKQVA